MWILKPRGIAATLLVLTLTASVSIQSEAEDPNKLKKDEVMICQRWQWSGPAYEGRVVCIEWVKKDCSQRLYKEICKLGG